MSKTGYFFHSDCSKHDMGAGHPECPERLAAIDKRLRSQGVADLLDWREAPLAPIADLELAHGRMHLASLRGLSDGLRDEIAAGGPTHAQVDPDTSINIHSWDAILVAAGAAIDATDAVIAGELANAFCAVRPPGHHAGPDFFGGYCFLNNTAIAAQALRDGGKQRVAVLDVDYHHGNGTQTVFYERADVLTVSIHGDPATE